MTRPRPWIPTLILLFAGVPVCAQGPAPAAGPAGDPPGTALSTYTPPTARDRLAWFARSSFGLENWAAGTFTSAFWTAFNRPEEWGDTWEGFGKRFASRQACVVLANGVEAGLGAAWGEDPRYRRRGEGAFWSRTGHAFKTTFVTYNRDGGFMPAYARYAGLLTSGFTANTWAPPSCSHWHDGMERAGWGILERFAANLFAEFWPDIWKKIRGK